MEPAPQPSTYPQAILGHRVWRLKNGFLYSLGEAGAVWRPGENLAYCSAGARTSWKVLHDAPARHCHCGWNAWCELSDVRAMLAEHEEFPVSIAERSQTRRGRHGGVYVLGALAGAGATQLHHNGWRSERAQVIGLLIYDELTPEETAAVEARYGVRVAQTDQELAKLTRGLQPPPAEALPPPPAAPSEREVQAVVGGAKRQPEPSEPSVREVTRPSLWWSWARGTEFPGEDSSSWSWIITLLAAVGLWLSVGWILTRAALTGSEPAAAGALGWVTLAPTALAWLVSAPVVVQRLGLGSVRRFIPVERGRDKDSIATRRAVTAWEAKSLEELRQQATHLYRALICFDRIISSNWTAVAVGAVALAGVAATGWARAVAFGVVVAVGAALPVRSLTRRLAVWLVFKGRESKREKFPTSRQGELIAQIPYTPGRGELGAAMAATYVWDHALLFASLALGAWAVTATDSEALIAISAAGFLLGLWIAARPQPATRLFYVLRRLGSS